MKKHMKTIMKKIQTGAQWSRYCLRSLFVTFLLMLTFGVGNAWGDNTATITRRALDDSDWSNMVNSGTSSAYITWKGNDAGQHVTFKLSGGTFENYSTYNYFYANARQTHTVSWTADPGYTVNVTRVEILTRSYHTCYVTVGSGTKTGDIKGDECNKTAYANYSPGLGNGGSVAIVTEDEGGLIRANFFIHTITVTYTIEGVGSEVRFNANSTTPSFATNANPYYLTQDSVRFKLDIPNYDNDHFYVHNSNDNAFIKWEPNSGFSIAVTGVTFNGCNATYKAGLSTRTGSSWIKTYSAASRGYSSNAKIGQNTSTYTTTFTTSSNTTVFPSGNALGNNDYFNVFSRKKDSQTDKADGSNAEFKIYYVELSYRVTPPAPIRKNYSETLSCYQYVAGRSNNTVTLTDYFRPFHVGDGVSMSYEVKKKNGSGVYETINSGFDITSNVFKTTVIGEYQIHAKSNATGAFTESFWSEPIEVTVEEVKPLTLEIGSRELYVDETSFINITEQLNTTQPVNFEYDANFFEYNTSTGVLTAKNIGNASFNTISKTIHVTQAAAGIYEAVDIEIPFTIKKYANSISCSWGAEPWSKNLNFDEEAGITFSSNNDTGTPIVVTQSPASSVATYDGTNNKIVANYRTGNVTWEVSQEEDYKYQAATTKTLSVNVGTIRGYDVCYVLEDRNENSFETAGESKEFTFSIDQPGDTIYFDAKYEEICVIWCVGSTSAWALKYKVSGGGSYQHLKDENNNDVYINCPSKDTYYSFKYAIPENARKFQFDGEAGAVGKKFVKNVRVSRKRWLKLENAGSSVISELDMPINTRGGNVTRNTFYINYSTCADRIKLVSNNDHVKFAANNSTTYEFDVENGTRKAIELTYTSPADAEDIAATITVYTPYEHKTLTVNAETKGKLSTTIEYKGADSYAVDHANMSATDLFQVRDENGDLVASPVITLSSSVTGVINTVSSNTAIDFLCGGSATITASYAGDAKYAAASDLGQTITVNKLSDAISWSSVGDDGKIHVWADTDIPTSIASANSDIASYSVASANPYLSVTEEEGVYTLHAGIVGEVALTATSAGDCTYATASGSKTIAVDPREHAIIWDQDLVGIQTDDRGYIINRRITLNAYAVDNESNPTNVPVSYEITGGGTFATIENGNELVINVANLSGTLSTTITATTTVGTKYAIVSETKTISVVRWGTNTAKSADNTSDIVDGKIVISAPHATFTFSGQTAITEFGYATVLGKPEGYKLAQSLDKNGGSKTYNFSWVSTNANCSIQVNKISFWIKAYDSDAFVSNKAKVSFDGADEVSVGTAAMTANDGDFKHFSKPENYTNRNVPVVCRVTGSENFDFYIKNISIEYTVYTTAPSATGDIEQVDRTINASDKKTVDVRSLFSYATPAPSDFEYSYEIVGAPEHAFLEGGYMFWADAVGDYTVRAKVNMDEDHRESEWGSEKTIRVNKVPYVFNNSVEDKDWQTTENWRIGSWPIENLPTEDDDVIVRGHLTIDEEIVINSMTIDAGEGYIVEIAPTGGLTVGAGGVIGATSDNLILKAGTSGVEKGQTGYLRISPDYAGAMPEATVELFSVSYYDQAAGADNSAVWQGVGSPISEAGVLAKSVYTSCWVYSWNEATDGWVNNRATLKLTPFVGFSTTQKKEPEGRKYTYEGHLVSGAAPVTMDLAYTAGHGTNLLANSWAAPISIPNFESSDFVKAAQTIYILNAGTKAQSDANVGDFTAPGKYIGVPIQTASELAASGYPVVIPSMQGFWVQAEGASAQLRLDYSRLVWGADYSGDGSNQPLRAPKHNAEASPVTGKMKVSISAGGWSDFIFLLESEKYLPEYEDGYDAIKIPSGGMDLFTVEGENYLGVDATNSIIGTRVGVRTSEETAYTMTFSHLKSESDMSLWDLEADQKIEINEGTTYTFFAEPNAEITDRFLIIERAGASTNTTGVDDAEDEANVHKFIKDNQLYILKNGVLYNGTGARVK